MKRIISLIFVCVLLLASVFTLTSCASKRNVASSEDTVKTLVAAGYEVETVFAEEGKHFDDGRIAYIRATKGFESVVIKYYSEDTDIYSKFVEAEEDAKKLQAEYLENGYNIPVKAERFDNVVWYGSEAAIADANLFVLDGFEEIVRIVSMIFKKIEAFFKKIASFFGKLLFFI